MKIYIRNTDTSLTTSGKQNAPVFINTIKAGFNLFRAEFDNNKIHLADSLIPSESQILATVNGLNSPFVSQFNNVINSKFGQTFNFITDNIRSQGSAFINNVFDCMDAAATGSASLQDIKTTLGLEILCGRSYTSKDKKLKSVNTTVVNLEVVRGGETGNGSFTIAADAGYGITHISLTPHGEPGSWLTVSDQYPADLLPNQSRQIFVTLNVPEHIDHTQTGNTEWQIDVSYTENGINKTFAVNVVAEIDYSEDDTFWIILTLIAFLVLIIVLAAIVIVALPVFPPLSATAFAGIITVFGFELGYIYYFLG